MNHLSIYREIVSDLLPMEVKYGDEDLALLLLVSLLSSFTKISGHHNTLGPLRDITSANLASV
jgi:glutamate mutase epsilon subunit